MKIIFALLVVCMLGGCRMEMKDVPMPSEMPSIMPTATPEATESPVALAGFETQILDAEPSRVRNLELCAATLDGVKVEPGAEFSFNGAVGERTSAKGYEKAKVLIDGKRDYAIGGGVCQISSTLFNAAEAAGMEILERHTHTNDVHYIELGRDAAVAFGTQDFRFRNPLPETVQIAVSIGDGKVQTGIYKLGKA